MVYPYAAAAKSLQSCPTLCDPIDGSPPGSTVPGILQARHTGVGCHFLLQCVKVKSESEVSQLCPTLSDPIDRSLPGSSIHGIFQVRVLEWGSIAFSNFLSYNLFFLQIYFLFNFFKCIKQSCLKFLFISWGWQYSGYLNRCPPSTFVNFIPWPQPRFIYP